MRSPLVLVVRENDSFSDSLREAGFRVVNVPASGTEPLLDLAEAQALIADLAAYDGLFFTSRASAEVFVSISDRAAFNGKIYALGERSRAVLEKAGFSVEPNVANSAIELIESFGREEFAGKHLLFVRGERSLRTIPDTLGDISTIDEAVVYRTIEHAIDRNDIPYNERIDWICFFSPSGVESFAEQTELSRLNGVLAAAIGTTTAKSADEAGFTVGFVSDASNAAEFAKGLIGRIKSIE